MPSSSTSPQCKKPSTRRAAQSVDTSSCRSHLDTTGVQALIDTRTEVERWADRPVEVCILAPRPTLRFFPAVPFIC